MGNKTLKKIKVIIIKFMKMVILGRRELAVTGAGGHEASRVAGQVLCFYLDGSYKSFLLIVIHYIIVLSNFSIAYNFIVFYNKNGFKNK